MSKLSRIRKDGKASIVWIRQLFNKAVEATPQLNERDWLGFVVGFRMYERIQQGLGRELTDKEAQRIVIEETDA